MIVQKALESDSRKPRQKISESIWRFFSVLAGGLILPGGEGLLDPCERDGVDSLRDLSEQDREDITTSAQACFQNAISCSIFDWWSVTQPAFDWLKA